MGIAGAAAFLGGEAAAGAAAVRATERAIAAAVQSPIPLREAVQALPYGLKGADFGELAGFQRGQAASSGASIEATAEIIARLKAAGVSRNAVSMMLRGYVGALQKGANNEAALHRVELLKNILRIYR